MTATAPALELRDITKWFGSLAALRDVTFTVRPGTLHALLGENGAGKSTLMHIAYGMLRPELGSIRVDGHSGKFRSPRDARAAGIGMVHQHPTSIAAMTVAENVELSSGAGRLDGWSARRLGGSVEWVRELSEELGLPLDPLARVEKLPISMKQRLEIVKAVAGGARLLLLDEPTAVLAPLEAAELMSVVRNYVALGNSAILITHKLTEALANAEEVTVLRRGIVTHRSRADDTSADELAEAMIGRKYERVGEHRSVGESRNVGECGSVGRDGELQIHAHQLELRSKAHAARPRIDLEIRPGEIVGIAAVEGNGQRELLRTIAGISPPWSGLLDVRHPIAFIPEDRTTEALVADLTLTENVVLGDAGHAGWRVDWTAAERRTAELLRIYQVRARGPGARARSLSGGNQQRLVLARALDQEPSVVVAENPTRGLDVAAAAAVHRRLQAVAEAGGAVLFHSTDLDEVMERSDRILVMRQGELLPAPPGSSYEEVGRLMLGAE